MSADSVTSYVVFAVEDSHTDDWFNDINEAVMYFLVLAGLYSKVEIHRHTAYSNGKEHTQEVLRKGV